jgi:hypothetical protein
MIDILLCANFLTLLLASFYAFKKTRDPLHPVLVLTPFLSYIYVYRPLLLHNNTSLYNFINQSDFEYVCTVNLVSLAAFLIGGVVASSQCKYKSHLDALSAVDSDDVRRSSYVTGIFLGTIAFSVFWHTIWYNGGPFAVFSQKKPFLISPIGVGYYNELPLLTFPALIFLAVAWQGKTLTLGRILALLLVASPQLAMGTFGGRRGPAFIIFCTLLFVLATIRRKKLRPWHILVSATILGALLITLTTVRGDLFRLGTQGEALYRLNETLTSGHASEGDEVVYSASQIINARRFNHYFWGTRYITLFVLRPIPSAIFPNKYEIFGMTWMVTSPGSLGYTASEWKQMQGFAVAHGSAGGFISDLYLEFWWFGLLGCFLIGYFFDYLRRQSLLHGGVWTMIFLISLALSIYLPTQNVEAWGYRQLLLSAMLFIFWRYRLKPIWQPYPN